jgi:hypothetical protein
MEGMNHEGTEAGRIQPRSEQDRFFDRRFPLAAEPQAKGKGFEPRMTRMARRAGDFFASIRAIRGKLRPRAAVAAEPFQISAVEKTAADYDWAAGGTKSAGRTLEFDAGGRLPLTAGASAMVRRDVIPA